MDVRIGDLVRFISEKIEGKVTSIIDSKTVNVFSDEYGFEIPASINDLVVIKSDFNTGGSTENKNISTAQKGINVNSTNSIYIAFVPENYSNLNDSRFDIFLINDTQYTALFSIFYFNGEKYTGITATNCNPESKCLIGTYSLKELDVIKSIHTQVVFFVKGNAHLKPAIDSSIKVNAVNLCKGGSYKQTKWFESVALLRSLSQEDIEKTPLIEISEKEIKKAIHQKKATEIVEKRPAKQMVNNILEVDLHIDQLLDDTTGMENKDILDYQMEVFHKTLEEYKLRAGQKIVFIHGKGDGVLRQRILWELKTKYKRFNNQDASFKQYGYGATMVTIR